MPTDISRETSNVLLPKEVSSEIWAKTIDESAAMQLATRRDLPGAGQEFQTIEGEPEAAWVNETEKKQISKPTFGTAAWKGYSMAVIIPFSNQFRRDKTSLYNEIVARAPQALGTKLDETVFGDGEGVPGEYFDTFKDVGTATIGEDTWAGLVTADSMIADQKGILNGWAMTPAARAILLNAMDKVGRPLFITSMNNEDSVARLMGHPTYFNRGVAGNQDEPLQLGIAGDWTSAYFGVVEGISMQISDQATLTYGEETINLFQQNMFAIRFEFEVGFKLKYPEHFVRLLAE